MFEVDLGLDIVDCSAVFVPGGGGEEEIVIGEEEAVGDSASFLFVCIEVGGGEGG